MRIRFSIAALLILTAFCAISLAWWRDHQELTRQVQELEDGERAARHLTYIRVPLQRNNRYAIKNPQDGFTDTTYASPSDGAANLRIPGGDPAYIQVPYLRSIDPIPYDSKNPRRPTPAGGEKSLLRKMIQLPSHSRHRPDHSDPG